IGRQDLMNRSSPSREISVAKVSPAWLTGAGRRCAGSHGASALVRVLIQMSNWYGLKLWDEQNTTVRLSAEICGRKSSEPLLMAGPRFTGSPKGADTVGRVATQISKPPWPPDRLLWKYSDRPSGESLGASSSSELLIVGRFTGVPQGEESVGRVTIQMSRPPEPPGAREA